MEVQQCPLYPNILSQILYVIGMEMEFNMFIYCSSIFGLSCVISCSIVLSICADI